MPSKLLVWNIQNFTLNKIDWTIGETVYEYYPGTQIPKFFSAYNTLRNEYILSNVQNADPDIFVVIEVISGRGPKGSLVSNKGATGVLTLLSRLRTINSNWCLVPPLKLTDEIQVSEQEGDGAALELVSEGGYTEAIAVFFRKDKMDFIGPYIWPDTADNAAKTSVPAGTATPGAYPDAWKGCLPDGNFFAGQFQFFNQQQGEYLFPDIGSRRPFFTKFREKNGLQRIISIASVHYPPKQTPAIRALMRTTDYFNDYPIAPNEVVMIAGDYNINPYATIELTNSFWMSDSGFKALLTKSSAYNSTMNYTTAYATPAVYKKAEVIYDNIAARFGGPGARDGAPVLEVIDRVANQSLLYTPMQTIMAQPSVEAQNELFRVPLNYKKLGPNPGTSDHLALLLQI